MDSFQGGQDTIVERRIHSYSLTRSQQVCAMMQCMVFFLQRGNATSIPRVVHRTQYIHGADPLARSLCWAPCSSPARHASRCQVGVPRKCVRGVAGNMCQRLAVPFLLIVQARCVLEQWMQWNFNSVHLATAVVLLGRSTKSGTCVTCLPKSGPFVLCYTSCSSGSSSSSTRISHVITT